MTEKDRARIEILNNTVILFNGQKLKNIRKSKNLTQDELASMIYFSNRSVQNWENGVCEPNATAIIRISYALGVKPQDFMVYTKKTTTKKRNS